jgi:hypothetical protein
MPAYPESSSFLYKIDFQVQNLSEQIFFKGKQNKTKTEA